MLNKYLKEMLASIWKNVEQAFEGKTEKKQKTGKKKQKKAKKWKRKTKQKVEKKNENEKLKKDEMKNRKKYSAKTNGKPASLASTEKTSHSHHERYLGGVASTDLAGDQVSLSCAHFLL